MSKFSVISAAAMIIIAVLALLLPPTGVIDNSVIAVIGELNALIIILKLIDSGKGVTIRKGNSEITTKD